jgi:hypothetical protein
VTGLADPDSNVAVMLALLGWRKAIQAEVEKLEVKDGGLRCTVEGLVDGWWEELASTLQASRRDAKYNMQPVCLVAPATSASNVIVRSAS